MFVAVVLCGAGASIAAATRSDRALWLNPASPGALVEYSINSDGTGRTQISDFGPQVDQHLSGDAYPFFTLSRSQDGSEFSMGGLYVGSPGVGYPSTTMGLSQLVPSQYTAWPYFGVGNPDFGGANAVFSPDGTWIAFTIYKCFEEGCSSDCQKDCADSNVYVEKTDGTALHEAAPNATSPTWSADGKWLTYQGFAGNAAFGTYTGVYVVRRNGEGRKRIVINGSYPVFAPRGSLLAYRCGGKLPDPGGGAGHVWRPSVCVATRNGSGKRVIATGYAHSPLPFVWSPDATKIAITVPDPNQVDPTYYGHLVVLSVTGAKPVNVLRAARIQAPLAWSPDSRHIAYLAQTLSQDVNTDHAVYVASTTTHHSTFITDDPVSFSDIQWANKTRLTYLTFLHASPSP